MCSVGCAAAAIGDSVCSGAVPGHTDEEWSVVAVVGWPPVLGIGHKFFEVTFEGLDIEFLEFLGVVEIFAHRVAQLGVLMEHSEVELVWPPVQERHGSCGGVHFGLALVVHYGAFAVGLRVFLVVGLCEGDVGQRPEAERGCDSGEADAVQHSALRRCGRGAVAGWLGDFASGFAWVHL